MMHTTVYVNIVVAFLILFVSSFFIQCSGLHINPQASKTKLNNPSSVISCSSLNISALQVVTFDLFGELMLTESSLHRNIAALLPSLSSTDVSKFTDSWLDAYASYLGESISPSVTHQFFQWVIRSSLVRILDSYGLSTVVLEGSTTFDLLVSAWGKLQPRPGATEVLAKLSKKYQLGLFSNGDKSTLQAALRIFPSSVNISLILSSDYPVHCFEPCPAIYAQALDAVNSD
jgi:FMN phosphatase YigB (HAD superfamily)